MKLALFVEGQSDVKTMPILVKKLLGKGVGIISRKIERGNMLNARKVREVISDVLRKNPDLSKVIVCVDSECTPLEEMEDEVQRVNQKVASEIPVHYVVVGHALEGWLLADVKAVHEYLGGAVSIPPSATLDCKPKKKIKELFWKAGRYFYSYRDGPRIAEMMDLNRAMKNNRSLASFCETVKDP